MGAYPVHALASAAVPCCWLTRPHQPGQSSTAAQAGNTYCSSSSPHSAAMTTAVGAKVAAAAAAALVSHCGHCLMLRRGQQGSWRGEGQAAVVAAGGRGIGYLNHAVSWGGDQGMARHACCFACSCCSLCGIVSWFRGDMVPWVHQQ
jgi:hypothetical protein